MRLLIAAGALALAITSPAEARHRSHVIVSKADPGCNILWPCEGVTKNPRGEAILKLMGGFGVSIPQYRHRRSESPPRAVGRATADRRATVSSFGAPDVPVLSPAIRAVHHVADVASQYLPHPDGCPRTAFCGCGAARDLGLHDRTLWLAASWYRFQRGEPAPNAVAVRRHHVFVLKQQIEGNKWLVADYNSGGHRSRLHVRSISGYTIVHPKG